MLRVTFGTITSERNYVSCFTEVIKHQFKGQGNARKRIVECEAIAFDKTLSELLKYFHQKELIVRESTWHIQFLYFTEFVTKLHFIAIVLKDNTQIVTKRTIHICMMYFLIG